jgi:glyoxylase-like metal-dependent hydrolase (beta-lactamase superfamily II)/rhodanese-related sulfurtransferase
MSTLQILPLDTVNLGDRSYVVAIDGVAVAVDPQRDIDRVTEILDRRGWRLTHVVETHVHNDYVSGGMVLARQTGAAYVLPADSGVSFDPHFLGDGEEFRAGDAVWRGLHTPGHTPQHMSYAVEVAGAAVAVFTGGSMLHGSVGRPDLLGPALTDELANAQWHSVRRLADLPADVGVYPTHGFGSFCSATATTATDSTIADQRLANPACRLERGEFVAELLAGLDAFPAYYAHMGPANAAGAGPIDLSLPAQVDAAEIARRLQRGEWVVDLRSRRAYADGHVAGSLPFDADGNAITYLGWLIPWGTPVTLLGADADQVAQFQRDLARIGIDRPAGYAVGTPAEWTEGGDAIRRHRRIDFTGLAAEMAADADLLVLDARRRLEWADGHAAGALHVPLHELGDRLDEVAALTAAATAAGTDPVVRVYCGSGFRAAIAVGLLQRAGIEAVHVDDDVATAPAKGVPWAQQASDVARFGETVTA